MQKITARTVRLLFAGLRSVNGDVRAQTAEYRGSLCGQQLPTSACQTSHRFEPASHGSSTGMLQRTKTKHNSLVRVVRASVRVVGGCR